MPLGNKMPKLTVHIEKMLHFDTVKLCSLEILELCRIHVGLIMKYKILNIVTWENVITFIPFNLL